MSATVCPYCGSTTAHTDGCATQSSAIARAVREALQAMEDQRTERLRALAQIATSSKRVRLASDQAQLIVPNNENRGVAIVINADPAQVKIATDENLLGNADEQVPLLGRNALIFTSPAELWGLGSTATAQDVFVLELPPGRQDAEFAQLVGSMLGSTGAPQQVNVAGDAGFAQTQAYTASGLAAALLGLIVNARMMALGPAGVVDRLTNSGAAVAGKGLSVSIQDVAGTTTAVVLAGLGDGQVEGSNALVVGARLQLQDSSGTYSRAKASASSRTVSAVNTAQAIVLDTTNLHDTLAIVSVTSAGTANLVIEASVDNVNWVAIDTIAAAAANAKQYVSATVGATTAVSPLSFRYIRITAGAAGAGNTTTLTISEK